MLENAIKNWDNNNSANAIKSLVTEIYAHVDGTYTVNIGVHSNGCGGVFLMKKSLVNLGLLGTFVVLLY